MNWNGSFVAFAKHNNLTGADLEVVAHTSSSHPVDSLYGSGATWQIAAVVPEPATFIPGIVALVSLGLVSLIKRRRAGCVSSGR